MALIDTVGAAGRGVAQGALDYNTFLQSTANVNQLLANDKQRELMQQIPVGVALPQDVALPGVAAPSAPELPGQGVGLIQPNNIRPSWVPANPPGVGVAPPTAAPSEVIKLQGKVTPKADPGTGWWMPQKDYYPDQQLFPVNGQQNPLQNTAAKLGNALYNFPGNLLNVSANLVERPFVNTAQYLLTPEGQFNPGVAGNQVSDNVEFAPANSPGAGVVAPSPAPGVSSGSSGARSVPGSGLPGTGAAAVPTAASTSSSDEGQIVPRSVRNDALKASPEELNYIRDQLMAKRDDITRNTNEQLALLQQQQNRVLAQTRGQINTLTQYAEAARQAGNVGLMTQYRQQAEDLLAGANDTMSQTETLALQLNQQARAQYRENDLQLWTQQAVQAEYEFRNFGDPTRLTQIMSAYGYPIAIEDAGNGKYYVVDITADGQGQRRTENGKVKTYSSEDVGDMFMLALSDEFRALKAAESAKAQEKLTEHMFKLDEIDATARGEMLKEVQKYNLSLDDYGEAKDLGDGTFLLYPKKASGGAPLIRYNPNPEDTDGSGVPDAKVQLDFVSR